MNPGSLLVWLLGIKPERKPVSALQPLRPAAKPWPGDRELIRTIYTQSCTKIDIYMPSLMDNMSLNGLQGDQYIQALGAISVGMDVNEFLDLPMQDGTAVLGIVAEAIQAMRPRTDTHKIGA